MTAEDDRGAAGDHAATVMDDLLAEAHLAPPHELPALADRHARSLGADEATIYLIDLQQTMLLPFRDQSDSAAPGTGEGLSVDSTLAGRTYQHLQAHAQHEQGRLRLWLPLVDGAERLGVVSLLLPTSAAGSAAGANGDAGRIDVRWRRFATVMAELVMTKSLYGDAMVRLRRLAEMGLAAEMQWSLLPPLTFASPEVTVAGALEPAYQVAGDTFDYSVDIGVTRAAIFDGMGHGLYSAQLAVAAISGYRNARRTGLSLADTVGFIDEALAGAFGGAAFTTAVFLELDTTTGMLQWVTAGHPPPLLLRDGRLVKQLEIKPALPLGVRVPDHEPARIVVGEEHLQPGDRVVLYTDGVVEARSPAEDAFGQQRLIDLVTRNVAAGLPVAETLRRTVRALMDHRQSQLDDDATILLVQWRSTNLAVFKDTLAGTAMHE